MLSQRRILAKELFFRPRSRSKRRFHFLRFNFLPIERCPERMVLERRPLVIFVVGLLVIFLFRVVSTIRTTVVIKRHPPTRIDNQQLRDDIFSLQIKRFWEPDVASRDPLVPFPSVFAANGAFPVNNSYNKTPTAQTSTANA